MKTTLIVTVLGALTALPVLAAEGTAPKTASPPAGIEQWHQRKAAMHEVWQSLTPEERQKLQTARETAKSNPAVAEAKKKLMEDRKNYHEVLSSAMLKTDPSLAPVLEKFKEAKAKTHLKK
ncbi:MAG: hypothetical protein ACFUZC_22470 [Chthoniobacteraceae bacterium]